MSELVTDEIVEAAARAMWEIPPDVLPTDGSWPSWDAVIGRADHEQVVADARRLARATLEAAAPLIAARVLEEAADAWQRGEWADAPRRADRVQERVATAQHVTEWIRARARIEKGD